jgi:periplasmic divalent cation tolerance protein
MVLTTCASSGAAEKLAKEIVTRKLGACAQVEQVTSFYRWEDELCSDAEWRVTVKTTASRVEDLRRYISRVHDYEVPQITVVPVTGGSQAYLDWVAEATSPD